MAVRYICCQCDADVTDAVKQECREDPSVVPMLTLKGMNVDWHDLYGVQETDVVPSGFLEVGWLGNNGWAVDPGN